MSQDTPSKGRIERHLMRQRGAGVRAVTADFGFSFAPSFPSIAPPTPSQEPPAKRRKTAQEGDVIVAPAAAAPTRNAAVTSPKLPFKDIGTSGPQKADQDAQALPAVGEVARTKAKPPIPRSETLLQSEVQDRAPTKRSAKTTKVAKGKKMAKPADENVGDVDDSFVQGLKSRKKPPRRTKETARQEEDAKGVLELPMTTTKRTNGVKASTVIEDVLQDQANPSPATVKKPTNPTRTPAMSECIVQDELEPPPATIKKPVRKRKLPVSPDPIPAPSRARPKRQAAVSATEKVTMGFEVEDFPVDKLRRAAEPLQMVPTTRKNKAIPVKAPLSPPTTEPPMSPIPPHKDESAAKVPDEPVTRKTGRVRKATTARRNRAARPIEGPLLGDQKPPTSALAQQEAAIFEEVGVKKPAIGTKRKVAAIGIEVEQASVEPERPPTKRGRTDSTNKDIAISSLPLAKSDDGLRCISSAQEDVVLAPDNQPEQDMVLAQPDGGTAPIPDIRPEVSRSTKQRASKVQVATARKPLGVADANIVRKSLSPEKFAVQLPATNDDNQQRDIESRCAKRRKRFEDILPEKPMVQKRKPAGIATTSLPSPKTNDTAAAADAKDLDWLFAEPARRSIKPAARRNVKKSSFRFADRSCKDMDLDDLLESVAAFSSGTAISGKRAGNAA